MSLGDLLVLVLFVVFVILPSITRSQQQRRGGPRGTPGGPVRPGTGTGPRAPTTGGGAAPGRGTAEAGGGRGTSTFPPLDDDDLARRLAEARARVQRAMEARGGTPEPVAPADGPRARAGAPLVSGAPRTLSGAPVGGVGDPRARARGPLVSGGARTLSGAPVGPGVDARERAPATFLGREGRGATPGERVRRTADEEVAVRDLRAEAPQLEVERLAGGAARGPARHGTLRLDVDGVFSGIVWHQVLGAPRARRRVGGGPFPER